jgi:hypothetical protein
MKNLSRLACGCAFIIIVTVTPAHAVGREARQQRARESAIQKIRRLIGVIVANGDYPTPPNPAPAPPTTP